MHMWELIETLASDLTKERHESTVDSINEKMDKVSDAFFGFLLSIGNKKDEE